MSQEYAASGVDYTKIRPYKRMMVEVVQQTRLLPMRRNVFVDNLGCYEYQGSLPHRWKQVTEGLGNKNQLAEILYAETGTTRFGDCALDDMRMAFNDVAAFGAMPVTYTDEVAAGSSEWFDDPIRAKSNADGFYEGCKHDAVALVGGESPALRFLVKDAPVMSGCAVGIIAPGSRVIDNIAVMPGLAIVGAGSSGLHANAASLVLDRGPSLKPVGLFTIMPNGQTFIEEILTPTISYVSLVECLLNSGIQIQGIVPGTGGGLGKLMEAIPNEVTFEIEKWMAVPYVLEFMRDKFKMSLKSCLQTFNWGVGYYLFVHPSDVARVRDIGETVGYRMAYLGRLKEGPRRVHFKPGNAVLEPEN